MVEDTTARMKWFMVVAVTLGVYGIIAAVFWKPPSDMILGAFLPLIGLIFGKFGTIVDFLFGSSSGSAKKTDMMSEMAGTGTGDGTSKTTATIKTDVTKVVTTEPKEEQP